MEEVLGSWGALWKDVCLEADLICPIPNYRQLLFPSESGFWKKKRSSTDLGWSMYKLKYKSGQTAKREITPLLQNQMKTQPYCRVPSWICTMAPMCQALQSQVLRWRQRRHWWLCCRETTQLWKLWRPRGYPLVAQWWLCHCKLYTCSRSFESTYAYIYIYIYPTILFLLCNNTPQEIIQHTCQDTSCTWASALGSHGESSCIWHLSCHHPSRPHHLVGGDATVDQEAATPSFCFWTKDPTNAQWCSLPSWTTQCAYIRSDCRPSGQAGCNLEIFGHLQDGVGRALTEGHAPYHLHLASDIFIDILL